MTIYRSLAPRRVLPSIALQVLAGIVIGLVIGFTLNADNDYDAYKHNMSINNLHESNTNKGASPSVGCVIIINPNTKKKEQFVKAIKATWGSRCNQTTFYTTDKLLQTSLRDPSVVYVDSSSAPYYWDLYSRVLGHVTKNSYDWTLVGDEEMFVFWHNLERLLEHSNKEEMVVMGRVVETSSFLSFFIPPLGGKKMKISAGAVISRRALQELSKCRGFTVPRSSEKALIYCSESSGIKIVNPVDEEGQHLFHHKDMIALVPTSFTNKKADIKEAEGVTSCCSDHTVTFGMMSFKEQRVAHFASQKMKVFGTGGFGYTNTSEKN